MSILFLSEDFAVYHKALIELAKRHGSKYDSTWFSDDWTGMFDEPLIQVHKCFICNQEIIRQPYFTLINVNRRITIETHGLHHLKEFNLLNFV